MALSLIFALLFYNKKDLIKYLWALLKYLYFRLKLYQITFYQFPIKHMLSKWIYDFFWLMTIANHLFHWFYISAWNLFLCYLVAQAVHDKSKRANLWKDTKKAVRILINDQIAFKAWRKKKYSELLDILDFVLEWLAQTFDEFIADVKQWVMDLTTLYNIIIPKGVFAWLMEPVASFVKSMEFVLTVWFEVYISTLIPFFYFHIFAYICIFKALWGICSQITRLHVVVYKLVFINAFFSKNAKLHFVFVIFFKIFLFLWRIFSFVRWFFKCFFWDWRATVFCWFRIFKYVSGWTYISFLYYVIAYRAAESCLISFYNSGFEKFIFFLPKFFFDCLILYVLIYWWVCGKPFVFLIGFESSEVMFYMLKIQRPSYFRFMFYWYLKFYEHVFDYFGIILESFLRSHFCSFLIKISVHFLLELKFWLFNPVYILKKIIPYAHAFFLDFFLILKLGLFFFIALSYKVLLWHWIKLFIVLSLEVYLWIEIILYFSHYCSLYKKHPHYGV